MHMTGLSWLKPDLKYWLFSVGKAVTKYVIIAEVPSRLHVVIRIPISFKFFYNEEATVFKHQSRYLFLNCIHLRLLFESLARE
jgi:hypothetical protein